MNVILCSSMFYIVKCYNKDKIFVICTEIFAISEIQTIKLSNVGLKVAFTQANPAFY